eukprot:GHVO01024134.1.p1 GENE.GHVO01024134.1~~GHVO01024134.1.p1  ORF type:complete len:153 (+),score=11.27 GHVO01024134.1:97-555(+)
MAGAWWMPFLIMSAVGMSTEVVFTATVHSSEWVGECYLVMTPIYAAMAWPLRWVRLRWHGSALARACALAAIVVAVEVVAAHALRMTPHGCPWWDGYQASGRAWFGGATRWDYFPMWILACAAWDAVWGQLMMPQSNCVAPVHVPPFKKCIV